MHPLQQFMLTAAFDLKLSSIEEHQAMLFRAVDDNNDLRAAIIVAQGSSAKALVAHFQKQWERQGDPVSVPALDSIERPSEEQ